jgi:hypothetical protein
MKSNLKRKSGKLHEGVFNLFPLYPLEGENRKIESVGRKIERCRSEGLEEENRKINYGSCVHSTSTLLGMNSETELVFATDWQISLLQYIHNCC